MIAGDEKLIVQAMFAPRLVEFVQMLQNLRGPRGIVFAGDQRLVEWICGAEPCRKLTLDRALDQQGPSPRVTGLLNAAEGPAAGAVLVLPVDPGRPRW